MVNHNDDLLNGTYGYLHPTSIPLMMPDRKETPEVLLCDPRGKPILIRQPRKLGFKPPEVK